MIRTIRYADFILPFAFAYPYVEIDADVVRHKKIVTKTIFKGMMSGMELMEDQKPDMNDYLNFHVERAELRMKDDRPFLYIHLLPDDKELAKLEAGKEKEQTVPVSALPPSSDSSSAVHQFSEADEGSLFE